MGKCIRIGVTGGLCDEQRLPVSISYSAPLRNAVYDISLQVVGHQHVTRSHSYGPSGHRLCRKLPIPTKLSTKTYKAIWKEDIRLWVDAAIPFGNDGDGKAKGLANSLGLAFLSISRSRKERPCRKGHTCRRNQPC